MESHTEKIVKLAPGWVDEIAFESALLKSGELLNEQCARVIVVIPKGCKLLLIAEARLLSLLNQIVHDGKSATIDLSDCKDTLTFFNRIGFLDQLDRRVEVLPERPKFSTAKALRGQSISTLEFGLIDPSGESVDQSLIDQLTARCVKLSKAKYMQGVVTILTEIGDNVCLHSESPLHGFMALQRYRPSGRGHIQIVISDSGIGISGSLRPTLAKYHPILHKKFDNQADIELVSEVLLRGGISSDGSPYGLGFRSSKEIASKFHAVVSVRQENFSISMEFRESDYACVTRIENLIKIRGTQICFDFDID